MRSYVEFESRQGWEVARTATPVAGPQIIGFCDRVGAGLDIGVVAPPTVSVAFEFGDNGLIVAGAAGTQVLSGLVTGLSPGPLRIRGTSVHCLEVRLSPLQAYPLLGMPLTELDGAVIGVDDLWGRPAARLRERLAAATTWDQRFALTEAFLARQSRSAAAVDPEVAASWRHIVTNRGRVIVDDLARASGWSRKRLWSRFGNQIGVTPKRAAMQIRFRSAMERLLAGGPLADVAVACGYTDQAHLYRDSAIFSDTTPRALIDRLTIAETVRTQAWGTFFQD